MKAQLLLRIPLFDVGVTRLPINLAHQLRGEMEFRSSCCHHIRTECNAVDRMLSSKNGYSFPKGNSLLGKKEFAEFWGAVEFLRVLLGSPDDVAASFQSSFLNVLTLSEQLSFHETRRIVTWIGSDATMARCGEIDFTHKVYTYFPTDLIHRVNHSTDTSDDEFIISISEICSFIFPLLLRGTALENRLVAYTGDNTNVITWLTYRRSGNERARFPLRILARCEQSLEFRTYPLYISTFNNVEFDNLARLPGESIREYAV